METLTDTLTTETATTNAATQTTASATQAPAASPQEAAGFVREDGTFAPGWTARLPEELGEYRESLGKFKTVGDLAKSYRQLEAWRSGKGTFVPGKDATPEEVASYRKAMGVPDAPEGYRIRPEALPEGMEWNDDRARGVLEIAHRHNIPEAALRELAGWQLQQEQALVRVATESARRDLQEGQRVLKEKWGDQYDANIKLAIQAATVAGVDPRSVPGFADPQTVMAFVNLARRISDDQFVASGRSSALGKGGAAEAREIQTNPDHSLYKRYHGGDTDTVEYVRSLLRQG